MSRQELAEAISAYLSRMYGINVNLDDTYVGKLERGEHRWPNERYREAFRHVLRRHRDAELGFYVVRATADAESANVELGDDSGSGMTLLEADNQAPWEQADIADLVGRFTREDLALDRRDMARALAGMIFGGTLIDPLERWLLANPGQPNQTHEQQRRFGLEQVEQIETAARMFRSWDDRFGGGLRRKAVVGQLSEVADMLRGAALTPLTRRLWSAMAQLAGSAATISWDCGLHRAAQDYYQLGLRAAAHADDRAFGANILAGMARQVLYMNRPGDAMALVNLAQTWSHGRLSSKITSMLLTRQAWAHASQGHLVAFRRATAAAEDALSCGGRNEEHPYWIDYFDQAELEGVTGGRLLELAHHQPSLAAEAADRIDRAIRLRRGKRLRSCALDRIGIAEARLIQGELEEACRLGHAAAAVAEQTPSDRVKVKMREFYQCTNAYRREPMVAELQTRVVAILRSTAA